MSETDYLKLHEWRYTQQIEGFYNFLIKETPIQNQLQKGSYMFKYNPRSRTKLLREIKDSYSDKSEGSD